MTFTPSSRPRRPTLAISTELLSPDVRALFEQIFSVAKTRSIVEWTTAPAGRAHVVCLTDVDGGSQVAVSTNQRRIWLVREASADPRAHSGDTALLTHEIRVATVLASIDMIALRLIDQGMARGAPETPMSPVVVSNDSAPTEATTTYTITFWPALPARLSGREYLTALSALARGPVTATELCSISGLSTRAVHEMIEELKRRDVLSERVRYLPHTIAAAQSATSPLAASERGLVQRILRWLEQPLVRLRA